VLAISWVAVYGRPEGSVTMKTLYDLLGVRPDADNATIRTAFRKAAKACHPDVNAGDRTMEQRFKEVTAAHAVLRNPGRRANYDRALERRRQELLREWNITLIGCGLSAVMSALVVTASVLIGPTWLSNSSFVGSSFESHFLPTKAKETTKRVAPAATVAEGRPKEKASTNGQMAGADPEKQHDPAPQENEQWLPQLPAAD